MGPALPPLTIRRAHVAEANAAATVGVRCARALRRRGFAELGLWMPARNGRARRFYTEHGGLPDGVRHASRVYGYAATDLRYRSPQRVARGAPRKSYSPSTTATSATASGCSAPSRTGDRSSACCTRARTTTSRHRLPSRTSRTSTRTIAPAASSLIGTASTGCSRSGALRRPLPHRGGSSMRITRSGSTAPTALPTF